MPTLSTPFSSSRRTARYFSYQLLATVGDLVEMFARKNRPPARRAGVRRETSSCRARRRQRRPPSGRAAPWWATSSASCAFSVALPASGPKLSVFKRLPSASWKLTVPQDASRQHASSSPSGRSETITPSSETAQETASHRFRLADAFHGFQPLFLPETARRLQQTRGSTTGSCPPTPRRVGPFPAACSGPGAGERDKRPGS